MLDKEYVKTIISNGYIVNVGMDDMGQCYFFEFVDEDGELVSQGCGTYNTEYIECVKYTTERHRKNKEKK